MRAIRLSDTFLNPVQEETTMQLRLSRGELGYDGWAEASHKRFSRRMGVLFAANATRPRSTVTLRSRFSRWAPSTTALRTCNPGAMYVLGRMLAHSTVVPRSISQFSSIDVCPVML